MLDALLSLHEPELRDLLDPLSALDSTPLPDSHVAPTAYPPTVRPSQPGSSEGPSFPDSHGLASRATAVPRVLGPSSEFCRPSGIPLFPFSLSRHPLPTLSLGPRPMEAETCP